jgi:enoyl-CoA hydratase
VAFDRRDRCGVITINRPGARNAVDAEVAAGIEAALDVLEEDDDLRVGILTGVPPVFCAGADLKELQRGGGRAMFTERGGFAGIVTRERTKPVIAAVDGPALAGGTELVLATDLVVASHRATFGIPEVKRSLVAGAGGLFRLPRKIPVNVAMECALTGDPISAERAFQLGLVNQLAEDDHALEAALTLAERIAVNSPLAVRESRRVLLASALQSDAEAFATSGEALSVVTRSADFREGLAAFVEKRPPRWTGR